MAYLCSEGIWDAQSPDIKDLVAELALGSVASLKLPVQVEGGVKSGAAPVGNRGGYAASCLLISPYVSGRRSRQVPQLCR
jgi:hypothetical protein